MKKLFLAYFAALSLLAGGAALAGPQPGVNSPYNPVWSIPIDSTKWSYGLGFNLSPSVVAQDIFQLCGDPLSSTVVRITRIAVNGRATTAVNAPVFVIKRSSPTLGGLFSVEVPFLSSTTTGVPYDTADGPGKAVASAWTTTTNPILPAYAVGTLAGIIAAGQMVVGNLTTTPGSPVVFDWGNRPTSAPVLRNGQQCLALNLSSASYAGNLFDIQVEWTEE